MADEIEEVWRLPEEDEALSRSDRLGEFELFSEESIAEEIDEYEDAFEHHEFEGGAGEMLGGGNATYRPIQTKRVKQGVFVAGEPRIGKLKDNWHGHDYYVIQQPFSLEEPTLSRNYRRVDVSFQFMEDDVIAYDMFPDTVVEEQDLETEVTVSPEMNFMGVKASPISAKFKMIFTFLNPTIIAFGQGTNTPSWTLKDRCAMYGNKGVSLILQVPEHLDSVVGVLTSEAETTFPRKKAKVNPILFELDLSDVPQLSI